jgi:hypothetical protein
VKFVDGLWRKPFSIGSVLKKGGRVESVGSNLVLTKGEVSFKFKEIESGGRFGVRLKVEVDEAMVTGIPQVKVDINELHKRLGHPCEVVTKETGAMLGLHVVGKIETCSDCVMAKAKQKSVKKTSMDKAYC